MRGPSPRAAGTSTVRLLAVGGVVLLAGGCAGAAGSASTPGTTGNPTGAPPAALTESFAAGILPPGWETAGATPARGTSDTDPAAFVRLTAAATPAYLAPTPRLLATGHARFSFRGRFRVTARTPGATVGLATIENARRTENADLFVDARTGRCRVDLFRADTALSRRRCDDGRWHTVTLAGDFGSPASSLTWRLDGRRMPGVRSTGLAPSTVHRLWLGDATPGKTTTTDWADVGLRLR